MTWRGRHSSTQMMTWWTFVYTDDDVAEGIRRLSLAHHDLALPHARQVGRPLRGHAIEQGSADIARHVLGCRLTQEKRVQMRVDDVAGNGCGRYCSPRHEMPFKS
jgi:hypothetical protein